MRPSSNLWHSRGLRWGVAVATLLGSSLLAMFALMYWRSSDLLFETLDRSVVEQLELLSARPPEMLAFMITSRMNHQPVVLTDVGLFAADEKPIVGEIAAIPEGIVLDGKVHSVVAAVDTSIHWHAAGRTLRDGRVLIVARPVDEILQVRSDLVHGAVIGIIPAILLSLVGGALVGTATECRLRLLNSIAERIIAGGMSQRLPAYPGGDELDRLCMIVNRILERLEEGTQALKDVGENIAHDLRTPLTGMRARLERCCELAGPESEIGLSIGKSIRAVDQALSIVTALLRIAEIQHLRRRSAFAVFDLAAAVQETADSYQPVAEEKGVALRCGSMRPAMIVGDRQLMIEVLVNLVDNAVKFTPSGGHVGLEAKTIGEQIVVIISDTGPGILPEARAAVFQRFYRGEANRTSEGSGLGLSLVAAVVKLHGFAIRINDNTPGCRIELVCSIIDKSRKTE